MTADPLLRRRSLPPGATAGQWRADDGWAIRTMAWRPQDGAPGSLLFAGGRADFIEKYAEAYWTWRDSGLGLATFDWRGQGGSGRFADDAHRGHCDDFERWVDDLDGIARWFTESFPAPHFIAAHSMGGHLVLRHLARGGSPFARAVLLAPMMGIRTPLPPRLVARFVAAMARLDGERYGPMQQPYGDWQQRPERMDLLTGDADRFGDEHWWIAGAPDLAIGGVTYGWLAAAHRSIDRLAAPGALEAVTTPTLVLVGEHERLVDAVAARQAASRLPNARLEIIEGGRHELLRDADGPRRATQARIRAFLAP